MIRILVVDDHPVVREGLTRYLDRDADIEVAAAVGSGRETLAVLVQTAPDLVLLDMNLPDISGPALVTTIRRRHPTIRVLALSSFADEELVMAAARAGVHGYLLKDVEPEELREAVKRVAAGLPAFHPDVRTILDKRERQAPPLLSPRELQVLALMGQGLSNHEVAARLVISEKTVKSHVSHILLKLDVTDRTQAVLEGIRRRLIPHPN